MRVPHHPFYDSLAMGAPGYSNPYKLQCLGVCHAYTSFRVFAVQTKTERV